MTKRAFKKVEKDEFEKFVDDYAKHHPLEKDVAGMYEPPLLTYNDFSKGSMWPESVVAKVIFGEVWKEPNEYFILDSHEPQQR